MPVQDLEYILNIKIYLQKILENIIIKKIKKYLFKAKTTNLASLKKKYLERGKNNFLMVSPYNLSIYETMLSLPGKNITFPLQQKETNSNILNMRLNLTKLEF